MMKTRKGKMASKNSNEALEGETVSDWKDVTAKGGKYDPETQDPKRPVQSYMPLEVRTTSAGQKLGYDRYNKAFRPVGDDGNWAGSPDDVIAIGEPPLDSAVAKEYIEQLKKGGDLLTLIEELGYHHAWVSNLRVTLTRISQRMNAMIKASMSAGDYLAMKRDEKIKGLTGLGIPNHCAIKAVRQKKESDSAFESVMSWMLDK